MGNAGQVELRGVPGPPAGFTPRSRASGDRRSRENSVLSLIHRTDMTAALPEPPLLPTVSVRFPGAGSALPQKSRKSCPSVGPSSRAGLLTGTVITSKRRHVMRPETRNN